MLNCSPPEGEETAAVVAVESEVMEAIYVLVNLEMDDAMPLDFVSRKVISKKITAILNDFYLNGQVTWDTHYVDLDLIRELFQEIREGVSIAPVYLEDAIGFTVEDGSTTILVHF